jgi:hypothetical protein
MRPIIKGSAVPIVDIVHITQGNAKPDSEESFACWIDVMLGPSKSECIHRRTEWRDASAQELVK